ncbi:MAG: ABC transporter ATP-binding protein [Syntrophobacteraceae bacterium]|jgi:branched-chain amino acid transport system ATP-binding protein
MSEALLEVVKLNKAFGRVVAARDLNLVLQPGVLTSLIGPNGAGKSTLINLLTGFLTPDSGSILFQGRDITHLPIYRRVRQGLCRSFQVANIFPNLTVLQNVTIPALAARRRGHCLFGRVERETAHSHDAKQMLERIGLGSAAHSPACALSHGDQRLLEVGIAMAARPQLLFLDEPTAGMNPVERTKILGNIRQLAEDGAITFVIVEHDMDVVFSLSDRVVALNHGEIIGDGTPDEIQSNPKVREVYLGE